MIVLATLLTVGIASALANPSSNYTKIGDCQDQQACVYDYSVKQQVFGQEGQQNTSVFATVELNCHSVGEFNGQPSIQYCMTVSNTEIDGNIFKESTSEDRKYHRNVLKNLLSGWFCFIQQDDGKVVAVQHATNESDDAINFKKAIAAAFQANFKGTTDEEETDTQSSHHAHYRYQQQMANSTKMQRTVEESDIIDYTTGMPKEDFKFKQVEDIEYRNGSLYHSGGYTEVKVEKDLNDDVEDEHQPSFSDIFSASGSYNLDLQRCYSLPHRQRVKQRRSVQIDDDMQEESLRPTVDERKRAEVEIILIRERIPSIVNALNALNEHPERRQLFFDLRRLLELENQYGPPSQSIPAVQYVVNHLKSIQHFRGPQAFSLRKQIYTLLSMEGSHLAQMTLFEAFQAVSDVREKDLIPTLISVIHNAHMDLVHAIERLIMDEEEGREAMLLSLGVLASKAQPKVAHEIMTFLFSLLGTATASAEDDNDFYLVDLLLAMGNTGSKEVSETILEYINDPIQEIQIAAIRALLKFTHLESVRDALVDLLESYPPEEIVIMAVHTIVKGYHHSKDLGLNATSLAYHPILSTMVSAALNFNNTGLLSLVVNFLNDVGGEQAFSLVTQLQDSRDKRETDWDSTNTDYNLVASLSNRQSDVASYPVHTAYLWSKTLGNSRARMRAAAGVFMGRSNNYQNVKGYAKLYAETRILNGGTRTLMDAEILLQKTGSNIRGRVYIQIGSNVRTNYDRSTQCYNYNSDIYQGRYRLYSFRYRIHLYVTTLGVDINVNLEIDIDFSSQICATGSLTEARGSATGIANVNGRATLTADGSIHATLLGVARGGITAEVTFNYRPEVRAKAKVCAESTSVNYHACVDAHDSLPNNRLRLSAWYQIRSVRLSTCGGWIRYPCIRVSWGSRHNVLSSSWSLSSRGRQALIAQRCSGQATSTCSASLSG